MHKKLTKAEVKEMEKIIKNLPNVIAIENGRIKYQLVGTKNGQVLVPCHVDKAQFFLDQANQGISPSETVKSWLEKVERNKAQVALIYKRAGDQSQQS